MSVYDWTGGTRWTGAGHGSLPAAILCASEEVPCVFWRVSPDKVGRRTTGRAVNAAARSRPTSVFLPQQSHGRRHGVVALTAAVGAHESPPEVLDPRSLGGSPPDDDAGLPKINAISRRLAPDRQAQGITAGPSKISQTNSPTNVRPRPVERQKGRRPAPRRRGL